MAYTDIKTDLVINKMKKAKYDELLAAGQIIDTEIYYITDDNDKFYLKSEVYTKEEINELLANYTPGSGGSSVVANPELSGDEETLESITIDDVNYTLKGEEMIFSDTRVEGANILRNIQLGDDNWSIPEGGSGGGSNVEANPELDGTEDKLRGIKINSVNYSVMASEMVFSDVPTESDLKLSTLQIGDDTWSLVSEASVNQSLASNLEESKSYTDTKVAELVDSAPETLDTLREVAAAIQENENVVEALNAAVGSKANASEVYTRSEIDNNFVTQSSLEANPAVSATNDRLTSLRVDGVDYQVLPDVALSVTGTIDGNGNKVAKKFQVESDVWNLPNMIYSETEPENPVYGTIWLKPVE